MSDRRVGIAVGVPPAELRVIRLFADLSDEDLAWIAERSELVELEPGEALFRAGDPAEWMFLTLEGTLQARREHLGPSSPVFVFRAGDVSGTIPFSRMAEFAGTARAVTRSRVARFPKEKFEELLRQIPLLEPRFVGHLADRVRDATRRDAQFEKLLALGKLSAGLAHELNNPVAVVLRSISEARRRLDDRGRMTAELVRCGISPEAVLRIDALRSEAARLRPTLPRLDALTRSEREDAMAAWLAEAGVADPWLSAATFVDAGVDEAALARVLGDVPADARRATLLWLETGLAAQTLFASAEQAAERIASLVESVKAYTHMDRALDMVDVDVHQGLESTIALFATRLQEKGVILEREYAHALPKIRAYPGDLNQVWGHLIDNALDAVAPGAGRITVRTGVEEGAVVVEIRDNGPGIPPELQDRVWEPFFTTKAIGKGTGLGLDIARRIVVDQHGGELLLTSSPGDTRFTVRLPLTTISTFGI